MKKLLPGICAMFFSISANAQTLNLPARSAAAMNGTQFVSTISPGSMSLTTRENLIYAEISAGNVPDFYRNMVAVTSSATIGSVVQTATYYVIPDYLAVGHDTDYFLCPMSPMLATQIGNLTGCTLPTRKMVNDIWSAAPVQLAPSPISPGPNMTTVPVFDQHNTTVRGQRQSVIGTNPLGDLVSGDKKDVVISNLIYNTANRVVIYGWHYQSGTAIQPLSNVHADTYMDYSHGIRLVQNNCMLNGTTATTVQAILQSSTLNPILSDEGQMAQPYYPYGAAVTSLATPTSFSLERNTATSLKLNVNNDINATDYKVYLSADGTNFNTPVTLPKAALVITGLTTDAICYVKIAAYNSTYSVSSAVSEVLAAVPSATNDSILIVNGFDRASAGNTYNFVIQHGTSFYNNQRYFESATNEAVINGLVNLSDYKKVDYILGKESSANETFSSSEQTLVANYLKQGGHLFVSGSEIGWDLDHLGSTADKAFYNDYLKAAYVMDAPNNSASTFYTAYTASLSNSIFYSADSISFDNGSHGTYNVDYPDVIAAMNGSLANLHYASAVGDLAGIHFSGLFNGGTKNGKLVYLCFPFETIYPATGRDSAMQRVIEFFEGTANPVSVKTTSLTEALAVFPNPASDKLYLRSFFKAGEVFISIMDVSGRTVKATSATIPALGLQEIGMDISGIEPGVYFIQVEGRDRSLSRISIIITQ